MASDSVCTAKQLHHVCIAVKDIQETLDFYKDVFGTPDVEIENIDDQGVKAALVQIGSSNIEFIEPVDQSGSIAKFLERRGEGMHHICLEVENLGQKLATLKDKGLDLIDNAPRKGLVGNIAFVHPKSTRGVLIELIELP